VLIGFILIMSTYIGLVEYTKRNIHKISKLIYLLKKVKLVYFILAVIFVYVFFKI